MLLPLKILLLFLQMFDYGRSITFSAPVCDDCQQYLSCERAHIFVVTQKTTVTPELFGNSFCGSEYVDGRDIPKVCCSEFSNSKLQLLPEKCGTNENMGVSNYGRVTALYEFPWMALISYKKRTGFKFKCAGSIINYLYILTAAHCVVGEKVAGVRVGEYDIRRELDCQGETPDNMMCESHIQDILVEDIIVHEHYQSSIWILQTNDIALLRLKETIDFNHMNVGTICLPLPHKVSNESIAGRRAIVAGWGITETQQESSIMLKVEIPIVTKNECRHKYRDALTSKTESFDKIICAGELHKDSCNGDSGAPLFFENEYNGVLSYVQYGIVSKGPKQCGSGMPAVYTDVRKYVDWILEKIRL